MSFLKTIATTAAALCLASAAQAATFGFVNSPATNSSDWTNSVTGAGGTVNSNVDFEGMSTGAPLVGDFYALSDGVTLSGQGLGNVTFGAGPGQGNVANSNPGEGANPPSNYVADPSGTSSLTITFADAVFGAGLFIVDYFNPNANNFLTIEAFDMANNSLGLFTSFAANFQPNNRYFMGVASDTANIKSVVFTDLDGVTGDSTGIDAILFASDDGVTPAPIPLPASLPLLLAGMVGMVWVGRRPK